MKSHKETSKDAVFLSGMFFAVICCIGLGAVLLLLNQSMWTNIVFLIVLAIAIQLYVAIIELYYEKKFGKVSYEDTLEIEIAHLIEQLTETRQQRDDFKRQIKQYQIAVESIPDNSLPLSIFCVEKNDNEEFFVINCGKDKITELIQNVPLKIWYKSIETNKVAVYNQKISIDMAEKKILNLIQTRNK